MFQDEMEESHLKIEEPLSPCGPPTRGHRRVMARRSRPFPRGGLTRAEFAEQTSSEASDLSLVTSPE
jgi:hypothetical protein